MKTKISILLIAVGLLAVSCDNFLDVNDDPNNPSEVTPDLVLPTGLNYTAEYVQQDRRLNHLGNMMMFNFGEAQGFNWYRDEFRYAVNSTFYDNLFDDAYSSALKQYKVLANLEGDNGYYRAIGMIMQAYHFQILVDLYGSVPYSEALKRGENANPVYDNPEEIYKDLLNRLSGAISTIDSTASTSSAVEVGEDDTVFDGDMAKWKQFANTLKVRILSRYADVGDPAFINGELTKIQNSGDGYIEDLAVKINPGYLKEEEDKQNPYWNDLGKDASGNETLSYKATAATQFVVEYLQGTKDPRLGYIFEKPEENEYRGVNQGAPNDDKSVYAPPLVSNLNLYGGVLKGPTMGSVIMTKAEHELNLAALAEKGLNVQGTVEEHYKAGIEASFKYLLDAGDTEQSDLADVDADSAANAYISRQAVWSGAENAMDAIMTQKWIATMGINAAQAWFDYNRTGYPSAQPVGAGAARASATGFPMSESDAVSGRNDRPVRLYYPQSEATRNSANLPSQPDVFTAKIFWAN
ncbi:MAG TPA: SusD/RagB family nutrient-binding outer membrane lipoprotein [Fodinibius sp.]|nr:SusD/RagB family nutrient-binding outer membrane lipoprotein [Fodinibius sp.]